MIEFRLEDLKRQFPPIKENQFLVATLIAIASHVVILFGMTFSPILKKDAFNPMTTLEVTLQQTKSDTTPSQAYLIGPGAKEGALALQNEQETPSAPNLAMPFSPTNTTEIFQTITTHGKSATKENLTTPAPATLVLTQNQPQKTLRKRTISAAQHQSIDAEYLANWQKKIEAFGNAHYPKAARQKNLQGDLRLLVAINQDGSIHNITLSGSSGHPELDKSAIEIVQNAAPFDPLPKEVADEVDVLEIIRTWQFRGHLTAQK